MRNITEELSCIRRHCKSLPQEMRDMMLDFIVEVMQWQIDAQWLSALEAAGVDNWDGIEQAQEIHDLS